MVLVGRRVVQQGVPAQVRRHAQGSGALEQAWTAHGHRHLVHQPVDAHARIAAGAVAHRDVDPLAGQIHQTHGGVQAHVVAGVRLAETVEPGHQPFGAEGGRHADRERPALVARAQRVHGRGEALEALAKTRQTGLSRIGESQRAVGALEQRQPQVGLQALDLMADRRGRHVQLLGGARDAQVAGGGLEGAERVQRWQISLHNLEKLKSVCRSSRL